jgi:probable HAF family extracellular repeat protein
VVGADKTTRGVHGVSEQGRDWSSGESPNGVLGTHTATDPGIGEVIVGATHAVLWSDGEIIDLGTLGGATSRAYGVNNRTQVVGTAPTADGSEHAFLWQEGLIVDLNDVVPADSGWTLTTAFGIDQQGAIVGDGNHNGQRHAFLLIPSTDAE